ncbi:MAG: M48 family metallopeptidase [Planctomyces sp.]|nr:M48 family metallopeptidase [Planctomyces sp.]
MFVPRSCLSPLSLLLAGVAAALSTGCSAPLVSAATNAFGSRLPVLVMSDEEELRLGAEAYQEILSQSRPSTRADYDAIVQRVGQRIAAASGQRDFDWEFRVLAGTTQNAFCLPGGKVAIYKGLLPVCENEAGLAVVLSHEVAHAIARHGRERMRDQAVVDALGEVLAAGAKTESEQKRTAILAVYGAGTQLGVMLPFSRRHETEADSIGLMLMARAGYDPSEAPLFWRRFSGSKSGSLPELFSTHPADERRAGLLEDLLPQADQVYAAAAQKHGRGVVIPVARSGASASQASANPSRAPSSGAPAPLSAAAAAATSLASGDGPRTARRDTEPTSNASPRATAPPAATESAAAEQVADPESASSDDEVAEAPLFEAPVITPDFGSESGGTAVDSDELLEDPGWTAADPESNPFLPD